jgi:hypothetical protein
MGVCAVPRIDAPTISTSQVARTGWEDNMSTSDDSQDLAQRQHIVEHRNRFEDAWHAGQEPSIEAPRRTDRFCSVN